MQFSEDDLRAALKRKDPGPEFTDGVMARVRQGQAKAAASRARRPLPWAWFFPFRFHPALAAAVATVLLIGAWIGFKSYQQHQQEAKVIRLQREAEEKRAEQQAMLALRITSEKLNHVFQKVSGELPQDERIRRQRL